MTDHMDQSIMSVARRDVATLPEDATIQQALDDIRSKGIGERIIYFYVVNHENILVGVIPTRRLLTAPLEQRLSELMIRRVATISQTATILEACEMFSIHRLLAFPVVDQQGHIAGVVDIDMFSDEVFDLSEREQVEELFENIGLRVQKVENASPLRAFKLRFPWLLSTIGSGTICALLASIFEVTLTNALVLAFFLPLVLGLAESVSMQSMTLTIHILRAKRPALKWFVWALRREAMTALLLGAGCGLTVGVIVWLWRGNGAAAAAIGASVLLTLCVSCVLGLSVPSFLHKIKLDLKIAAGPVSLAIADICTIFIYFSLAAVLL